MSLLTSNNALKAAGLVAFSMSALYIKNNPEVLGSLLKAAVATGVAGSLVMAMNNKNRNSNENSGATVVAGTAGTAGGGWGRSGKGGMSDSKKRMTKKHGRAKKLKPSKVFFDGKR